MKTKHTQGEWIVQALEDKTIITNEYDFKIAELITDDIDIHGIEMEQANAKLIAAAPELLNAAQYSIECLYRLNDEMGQIGDNGDQALQVLELAIKKATP